MSQETGKTVQDVMDEVRRRGLPTLYTIRDSGERVFDVVVKHEYIPASPSEIIEAARGLGYAERVEPDYSLQVCVTHWRIYEAYRRKPYARFGFHLCPIEEGIEHEVVYFDAQAIADTRRTEEESDLMRACVADVGAER